MSCGRYPVDVKAVGLMQCRKQKNYMILVSWSDQNNILIYRTFENFKTFHKELKRKFPIESGSLRRSDRTIPRFKGWWLVENADKQIAWFPASYLEEIDIHKDIQNALSSNEEASLYFVVRAYESQKADELSLNNGVVVEVLRKSEDGWWLIRYNGHTGYMPSMCLQPYKNPHHKLQTIITCGLNVSTPNLCSSLVAPQPRGEAAGRRRVQACSALHQTQEDESSPRSRSRSLPRASSTPELESDSLSLSSGSGSERDGRLSWKPDLSRSLPEVEQARSSPLGHALASHSSKSPRLTRQDRNDSGFVESSAADLSCSLTDHDLAACVPKVPVRPSAHEILQKCSTVTKRAVQQSSSRPALQALLPLPSVH